MPYSFSSAWLNVAADCSPQGRWQVDKLYTIQHTKNRLDRDITAIVRGCVYCCQEQSSQNVVCVQATVSKSTENCSQWNSSTKSFLRMHTVHSPTYTHCSESYICTQSVSWRAAGIALIQVFGRSSRCRQNSTFPLLFHPLQVFCTKTDLCFRCDSVA